ncbi:hypothetical protein P7C71_g3109, partial [Lecanoromycetidae sp. Uapishka_2]
MDRRRKVPIVDVVNVSPRLHTSQTMEDSRPSPAANGRSQSSRSHLNVPQTSAAPRQRNKYNTVSRNLTQIVGSNGRPISEIDPHDDRGSTGKAIYFVTYGCMYRDQAPTYPNAPTIAHIDCTMLPLPYAALKSIGNSGNDPAASASFFSQPQAQTAYNEALGAIKASGVGEGRNTVELRSERGILRSLLMATKLANALEGRAKCYFINVDEERGVQDYQAMEMRGGSFRAMSDPDGRSSRMPRGMSGAHRMNGMGGGQWD